jgi:hypothetical protein
LLLLGLRNPLTPLGNTGGFFTPEFFKIFLKFFARAVFLYRGVGVVCLGFYKMVAGFLK